MKKTIIVIFLLLAVIGIATVVSKRTQQKTVIQNTCVPLSQTQALNKINSFSEVKAYVSQMAQAKQKVVYRAITQNGSWDVQVMEDDGSHFTTFNTYTLNKCGILKCSFSLYDKQGKFVRSSTEKEYPCI